MLTPSDLTRAKRASLSNNDYYTARSIIMQPKFQRKNYGKAFNFSAIISGVKFSMQYNFSAFLSKCNLFIEFLFKKNKDTVQ